METPILTLPDHSVVIDMLRITMLIYNYDKTFTINPSDNNIEQFVERIKSSHHIESLHMSETRKEALLDIAKNNPHGRLYKFISDDETDIQVGITINHAEKRVCIVFRGSESLKDWYYDFQVTKTLLTEGIKVHSGFYNQLHNTKVHEELVNHVKVILAEYPEYDIYCTGHSLGGALCTLFGYLLSFELEDKITVVSFASPRVGNPAWKKSFEERPNLKHYRFTNNHDIITAFPMYNYKHVGIDIHLYENSYKLDATNVKNCCICSCSLLNHWSISDHDCDLYYKRLLQNKW